MSINKTNHLAHTPEVAGLKDAIHVAIVSCRAGSILKRAEPFTINTDGEAIYCNENKSIGVVNPFIKHPVKRGEIFWGILKMQEVPNVKHVWEHPSFTFEAPTTPVKYNSILQSISDELGVTYQELMDACDKMENTGNSSQYNGSLDKESFEDITYDKYELWSAWSEESGIEFENTGTACCPEYDYPDFPFYYVN